MAVSRIAGGLGAGFTVVTNGFTCDKPTNVAQNNYLIGDVNIFGNGAVTPPTGWTLIGSEAANGTTRNMQYGLRAGASEPANYTWSVVGSPYTDISITAYTGTDSAGEVQTSTSNTGTSATPTATGITVNRDGSYITMAAAQPSFAWTAAPTGMTEIVAWDGMGWADQAVNSGATGDKAATISASDSWAARLVATQPPQTAVGYTPGVGGVDVRHIF